MVGKADLVEQRCRVWIEQFAVERGQRKGFLDASGLAADGEIRLGLEQSLDAFAQYAMVVEQKNTDHSGIIAQKPAGLQKNSWPYPALPC